MHLLSFLQCTNYTVVCDQIANKWFVLLNASILGEYRKKMSLRSASQARRHNSVTGSINKFWRGSKYTSNLRVWTKKQSFSSQNSSKTGVAPKKVFNSSSQNMHEFPPISGWNHKKIWARKIVLLTNSGMITSILGVSGLELHCSGTEPVTFFGAQSSLGGTILVCGGTSRDFRGAWPPNVPHDVGPAASLQQSTIAFSLKRCCSKSVLLKKRELFEVIKSWFWRLVYSNM